MKITGWLGCLFAFCLACGDDGSSSGSGGSSTTSSGSSTTGSGGASCDEPGKPEMTGPITGLQASYLAGDPIDVSVPHDADTARVIVGIYEVGSALYLGGTAEEAGSGATNLSFYAGVANGEVGTFYLAVELCSTSLCTTPFVRNTYDRADRFAPMLAAGETYLQTTENVGTPANTRTCPSDIPIQSFDIN